MSKTTKHQIPDKPERARRGEGILLIPRYLGEFSLDFPTEISSQPIEK
jgi:hypothetical protein